MGLPVNRIKLTDLRHERRFGRSGRSHPDLLTFTGLPTEGLGWEPSAIAAVVVGGRS